VGGLFSLESINFVEQNLFSFMKSHLFILNEYSKVLVYMGHVCQFLLKDFYKN
jgi:hypothetical protein